MSGLIRTIQNAAKRFRGKKVKSRVKRSYSLQEQPNTWEYIPQVDNGVNVTPTNESFLRSINIAKDREKFMLENPIYKYPNSNAYNQPTDNFAAWLTTSKYNGKDVDIFNKELSNGKRSIAKEVQEKGRDWEPHIDYNALDRNGNLLGYAEGSLGAPDWIYDPNLKQIQVYFNKGEELKEPLKMLVKNHEVKHYTGHDADSYIYQYLVNNGIVDDAKIGSYYKDADKGEIGTHLAELFDFLGFRKSTPEAKFSTPEGKTAVTWDDVSNFVKWSRAHGLMYNGKSIFENIIDKNKFLDFINKYKFGVASTVGSGVVASLLTQPSNYVEQQYENKFKLGGIIKKRFQ